MASYVVESVRLEQTRRLLVLSSEISGQLQPPAQPNIRLSSKTSFVNFVRSKSC